MKKAEWLRDKKRLRLVYTLSLVIFSSVAVFFSPAVVATIKPLDRVVAIVDDDIILLSELNDRVSNVKERIRSQNTPLPATSVLQERILDQLVLESIQLQLAERTGIRVSDSELNQTMQKIASQNDMSLEQFQQQLAQEGMTYQAAREQVKREMLISRYQQRIVDSRVRVTEKEVTDFLNSSAATSTTKASYRIAHILLTFKEGDAAAEQATLAKANRLLEQVRNGGSFAELAISHSESSAALEGGDLGWRSTEELPTLFTDVVPTLSKGEIADPIKTSNAVHLVLLTDVKGGAKRVVEQARVRHILVRSNELRDEQESRKLINSIYQKVQQGQDFAELAEAYTNDPGTANSGGDLNWVSPGQMVPEFETVMNQTPVNGVSEPFRTEYGWHILQVLERRSEDIGAMVQANQARQILHRRRYEEELQNWLGEIRDESYVEIKI